MEIENNELRQALKHQKQSLIEVMRSQDKVKHLVQR